MSGKRVLVYGGSGALGNELVNFLKNKNYWVVSVDLKAKLKKENPSANENLLVDANQSFVDQETKLVESLKNLLKDENKLDAILNVAGGWAGGNAASPQFLTNSNLMWSQSVCSSLVTASLASKFLKDDGVLTFSGAAAALENQGTPGMIGYGLAKAAVHHLTKSLAAEQSGLPENAFVAAICPVCLDTPMNRKWMPKADHSTWTSLTYIAELFDKWINDPSQRPAKGSLVKLTTANNETTLSFH